jgi:hypothetical protein
MTPMRIQRKRTRGWRMPAGAVSVTRPGKFGNPFVPGREAPFLPGRIVADNRHAVSLYRGFAPQNERLVAAARAELRGRDLACWCRLCDAHAAGKPLGSDCPYCEPCHADVLLELANPAPGRDPGAREARP